MALPAQGLSGMSSKLYHRCQHHNIDILAQASSVKACQRERERVLHVANLEGKRPFVLVAVIRYRSTRPPADYIFSQLSHQVKKALSDSSATESPLYASFLRLCAAFKKLSAYAESIFSYTETVAALLDLKSLRLHTVAFGDGVLPAHVMATDGVELQPVQSLRHYADNHIVTDRTFQGVSGQHHVLLGSSGLWRHTHPRKAALHAAAFSAAPHVSTALHHHDPASAVVRSALRAVASRCAASPSARVSCLNSLSQLDRLRCGSRDEILDTSGVAPRMRGDIHPDMTACTLSFTAQASPRSQLRRQRSFGMFSAKMFRRGSFGDMSPLASPRASASSACGSTAAVGSHTVTLRAMQAPARHPDAASPRLVLPGKSGSGGPHAAHGSWDDDDSRAGGAALLVQSVPGSPLAGNMMGMGMHDGGSAASRQWQLLRLYLQLVIGERRLRRHMWGSLLTTLHSQDQYGTGDSVQGRGYAGMTQSGSAVSLQLFSNMELDESVASGVDVGAPQSSERRLKEWSRDQGHSVEAVPV